MALSWTAQQLKDGFVPMGILRRFAGAELTSLAAELVAAGLWEESEGGYTFHDYLEYNPSANEVLPKQERISEARREAGRRGGIHSAQAKRNQSVSKIQANVKQNSSPVPVPEITKVISSSPPTPTRHEALQEMTTTKPFAFDDPLPVNAEGLLKGFPSWYEGHLRNALAGRSPGSLASYASQIVREWRAGKNAPQAPLPDVPVHAAPPPDSEWLPPGARMLSMSELRAKRVKQNEEFLNAAQ
jgi:hypothetical protein